MLSTIKLKKMFRAHVSLILLSFLPVLLAACSINAATTNSEMNTNDASEVKPSEAVQIEEIAQAEILQAEIVHTEDVQLVEDQVAVKIPDVIEPKTSEAEMLLHDFMTNAKTLRADFTQIVIDEEGRLDENASSSGVFLLARPGKFRWQIRTPSELLILADGKNLWNYDVDLEQVTVKLVDETLSSTPAMLLSGGSGGLDAFKIKGSFITLFDGQSVQWLELVPVDTHNDFSMLRLGFTNKEIHIMELTSNVGQVIRIEFSDVMRNAELDDKLFQFSAPEYVDIIGDPQ